MGFIEFLPGFIWFYWFLPSFTGFSIDFHRVDRNFHDFSLASMRSTGDNRKRVSLAIFSLEFVIDVGNG